MKEKKSSSKVKGLFESVSAEEKISGKMIALLAVILVSFLMIVLCIITLSHELSEERTIAEITEETSQIPVFTDIPEVSETSEQAVTTVSEYILNTTFINQLEYQQVIEAESLELTDELFVLDERTGFSGDGYVSGFYEYGDNILEFEFDVPESQHYDISVCFASDYVTKNEIFFNGEPLFDFECTEDTAGGFVVKTYYGVFFEKGKVKLEVHEEDGYFDLDYIKLQNNHSIYSSKTDVSSKLINKSASKEAVKLMKYLSENFGEKIITGQYVSDASNIEIEKIYENTGNYPAIRFGDLGEYSINYDSNKADDIEAAVKWAENGGIVGYIWHWKAPMYEAEVYSEKTSFNLWDAFTDIDIANLSLEDLEILCNSGEISEECLALVKDIDNISNELKKLKDKSVPVLWRPLHEAGGDWFWWGAAGPDAYNWLWNLLYQRQTEYHKLNNLIWVWSAQGKEYFVGNSKFDIAAVDLYNENKDNTSYYKQYQWLYSLTEGNKLIALSECGRLPDMELTFRDRAVWSFFGLWYGDYILDKNGELSEQYNTRETLVKMYNSNRTITLDKYKNREMEPVKTTEPAVTTVVEETLADEEVITSSENTTSVPETEEP